jgi:hypothetical protein
VEIVQEGEKETGRQKDKERRRKERRRKERKRRVPLHALMSTNTIPFREN